MRYKTVRLWLRILGFLMGVSGILIVGYFFSWILAGGIFLILWGDNLSRVRFD